MQRSVSFLSYFRGVVGCNPLLFFYNTGVYYYLLFMVSIGNAIISGADIISKSINSGANLVADDTRTIVSTITGTFLATIAGSVITRAGIKRQRRVQRQEQLKDKLYTEEHLRTYFIVIKDKKEYTCMIEYKESEIEYITPEYLGNLYSDKPIKMDIQKVWSYRIYGVNGAYKEYDRKMQCILNLKKQGYKIKLSSIM